MDHPAVQQVVTFAIPHDRLGEDVAAAVVVRDGMSVTERDVREFAARRLADFKVPRKIVFLAEIPKGATGKLQRIGLAAKLGLGARASSALFRLRDGRISLILPFFRAAKGNTAPTRQAEPVKRQTRRMPQFP